MYEHTALLDQIKRTYNFAAQIPLHSPCFSGREKNYLNECIDSTFVSSTGPFVYQFEAAMAQYTGARFAVALVNGTQALFLALVLAGVEAGSLVLTQALTFVATANAVSYTGARPAFIDIDPDTLGMSPAALMNFLEQRTRRKEGGQIVELITGRRISAVVPMHTFGHACRIESIAKICKEHGLPLVEDAAESLGSLSGTRHTGTFGLMGVISFNGNKIITTGGGGAIITDDPELAARARHLSTTAKTDHPFEFVHDRVGYNFRMPNLNAALGLAQFERLGELVQAHRQGAEKYAQFFDTFSDGPTLIREREGSRSNYWLNAVRFRDSASKERFLHAAVKAGIFARSVWRPMHRLQMYAKDIHDSLIHTDEAYATIANLPSSVQLPAVN
ncbi:MAG: LegC family aminotransferase [Spirochaetales bacterium]|nr:LegC family aminotransferase [Spirochaetales bacterium]